jgi:hypothetical protein
MLNPFYFAADLIASTDIQLKCCRGDSLQVQTIVLQLMDSVSLVCGDATGNTFCGSREIVIWDTNLNSVHDLSTSTIFTFDYTSGMLTVSASSIENIGTHNFILKAQLLSYYSLGFFPQQTPFTVTIIPSADVITESLSVVNLDGSFFDTLQYQTVNDGIKTFKLKLKVPDFI